MKTILFSISLFAFTFSSNAQRLHIGVFGGLSAYSGDLAGSLFPGHKQTKPALGFSLNYEISDRLMLRGQMTFAKVAGADSLDKSASLKLRNLSFQSGVNEFSLMGEYYIFDMYENNFSPYAFAGVAVYHFDPYAIDQGGNKIFLNPLSTEGQGIPGYPQQKPYSLTQFAIPFGGGIKFVLSDNWRVGIEFGMRKLFTDYLDDVSTNYADMNDLLNYKGQRAVDMAYRGDEVAGGNPTYPAKGFQRGNSKSKDWYYFTGVHLTFRIGNSNSNGNRKSGCPASF
jgi:opacity protein-like surface antigen